MNDFELLQLMAVLYFIFAVRMKIWQTSLNTFFVFCVAFVVAVSHQTESLRFIFDNRVWIFDIALTVLFARVAYQQICKKYNDNFKSKCSDTECFYLKKHGKEI